MTRFTLCASVFGLFFVIINHTSTSDAATTVSNNNTGILDCFYEKNALACAKKWSDSELDRIEVVVTGKRSLVTFSQFLDETREFCVDGTRQLFGWDDAETEDTLDFNEETGRQARKKFGKKKKHLLKLLPFVMLLKAKLSLLLQLISTHFQLKFFAIAILSLLINIARFWIDLKKAHHPGKVIYYEHAQHQHHYDQHDDDLGGYWGRSSDDATTGAQELAYNSYADQH